MGLGPIRRVAWTVTLFVSVLACSRLKGLATASAGGVAIGAAVDTAPQEPLGSSSASVPLVVANKGFDDVAVWIIHEGGGRSRLGNVTGSSTGRFVIDHRFLHLQPFRVIAERAGARAGHVSRPVLSPLIYVQSGQRLLWTLEWNLQRDMLEVQNAIVRSP